MLTKCNFLLYIEFNECLKMCLVWESIGQARQHCDNSDFPYLFLLILSFVPPFCDYRIYNVGAETPNNVFIEPIHLLTHNSQPTLDMSNINIHEADWALFLRWTDYIINLLIFTAILFMLKAFWIHTNSLSPMYKEGEWPLWLLNSVRLPRPLHPWCGACVLSQPGFSVLQSPEVTGFISKEWQENVEGIYLWRGEGRGRVRGKLQGAISAEKWEWKGWKPINENQYEKAGRHKNWGGKVIE